VTPLSFNVFYRHVECIKTLLKHGADVNADFDTAYRDYPATALDIAYRLNKDDTDLLNEIIPILLDHGAKTYDELQNKESTSQQSDDVINKEDVRHREGGGDQPQNEKAAQSGDGMAEAAFSSGKTGSKRRIQPKATIRKFAARIRKLFRIKNGSKEEGAEL
jgi:hypothetical protein